jgi:hypothetical protein
MNDAEPLRHKFEEPSEGRGGSADAALRTVLNDVGATIVEPAGTRVTVTRADVGPDGQIVTPEIRAHLHDVLNATADEVRASPAEKPDR